MLSSFPSGCNPENPKVEFHTVSRQEGHGFAAICVHDLSTPLYTWMDAMDETTDFKGPAIDPT